MTPTLPDQTLAWVNQIRAERGFEEPLTALPQGEPREPDSCPVARAINANVGYRFARRGGRMIRLPGYVIKFIEAFDDGEYPELVR